jgi:hypothetical protein
VLTLSDFIVHCKNCLCAISSTKLECKVTVASRGWGGGKEGGREEGGLAEGKGVISKIRAEREISTCSTCMLQGFRSTGCVVCAWCVYIHAGILNILKFLLQVR